MFACYFFFVFVLFSGLSILASVPHEDHGSGVLLKKIVKCNLFFSYFVLRLLYHLISFQPKVFLTEFFLFCFVFVMTLGGRITYKNTGKHQPSVSLQFIISSGYYCCLSCFFAHYSPWIYIIWSMIVLYNKNLSQWNLVLKSPRRNSCLKINSLENPFVKGIKPFTSPVWKVFPSIDFS